jgi:hypothetical protein
VICSSQDHFRTGMRDLDHPVLADAKNIDIWHARKRDLQRAFPLDVTMVPSSTITITANGEHLTCGGFSPGETVCLGNFEFIVDYFGGLRRHLHGSTCSGTPSPWWAMIEDSVEDFLMASNEEGGGGFDLTSPRRHNTGIPPAPVTTTPWMENASTTQARTMVPPWTVAPRPDTGLPFEQCHTRPGGGVASASPCSPTHHGLSGIDIVKQARRQASRYRGPARHAIEARAHARGGEDFDGGLCLHSSSSHGSGSPS